MKKKKKTNIDRNLSYQFMKKTKKGVTIASLFAVTSGITLPITQSVVKLNATEINQEDVENDPIVKTKENKSQINWKDPKTKFNTTDQMNELYNSYGVELTPKSYSVESGKVSYQEGTYIVFENQNPKDIKVRYQNVANYRGEDLDIIFTFKDFTKGNHDDNRIKLGTNDLRLKTDGYLNTEYDLSVVKSGTNTIVPVTFIMKISDIDVDQYMGIPSVKSDYIAVSDTTNLSYDELKGYDVFGNYPDQMTEANNPDNSFVYYDKANHISGIWGLDRTADDPMNDVFTKFDIRLAPEPDTIITKEVSDENNDGIVENGETLNYTVDVKNTSADVDAIDVAVRDSILENLNEYPYVTLNDVKVSGSTYSGSFEDGSLTLDKVPASKTVRITYSIKVGEIPADVVTIANLVTDTGEKPDIVDPTKPIGPEIPVEICDEVDINCDATITPVKPQIPNQEIPQIELGDTIINKEVSDENNDGVVENGEKLNYTINVENPTDNVVRNVPVRDSMLENLPEYIKFNDDVEIKGTNYKGDLTNADLVLNGVDAKSTVTIKYSVTVGEIPADVVTVENLVTDNGDKPEICEEENQEIDCDATITPVKPQIPNQEIPQIELGDTIINKEVSDENNDGVVENGEKLNYTINVENPTDNVVRNVPVRDSMLENLPEYIKFNDDVEIKGTNYKGDLTNADLVLNGVDAKSTVTIKYSVTVGEIPADVVTVENLVTDNGDKPEICEEENQEIDCDATITPVKPQVPNQEIPQIELGDTIINKEVSDENNDGVVENGEKLNYTINVENPTDNVVRNVPVRDSMLENLPEYIKFNDDVEIKGTNYKGNLTNADLVLNGVDAKSTVTIKYSVTIGEIPADVVTVENLVTDNGDKPEICEEENQEIDCDATITPVKPQVPNQELPEVVKPEKPEVLIPAKVEEKKEEKLENTGNHLPLIGLSFSVVVLGGAFLLRKKLKDN